MKKIISLFLVVMMLSAMMITANAINKDGAIYFASDATEVTVGEEFTVAVMITADSAGDSGLKQTTFKYSYTDAASFVAAEAGALAESYANVSLIDGQITIMDTNKSSWATGSGELVVITFKAEKAGDFVVTNTSNNTQFQLISGTTKNTIRTACDPITIKIVEPVPDDVVVKLDEIDAAATEVELEKDPATAYTNLYKNVAVFNATLGEADVVNKAAGFIWVKDGVETANKYEIDGDAIAGSGTFEYGVAMYAIPADVTISAIPYYVK